MSDKIDWLRKHAYFPCSICATKPDQGLYAVHRAAGLRLYMDGRICEACHKERDPEDRFEGLPEFDPFRGLVEVGPVVRPLMVCSVVTMFGQRRLCFVTPHGEPKPEYMPAEILWVERAEDGYAAMHRDPPFCVLDRSYWLRGKPVE